MKRIKMIFVYNDYGVQKRVEEFVFLIKKIFDEKFEVAYLNADEIIEGSWINQCKLLIMPGGFDLGFKKKLNGAGNLMIKKYVYNGGRYLGVCAGAYYACSNVIFNHEGSEFFNKDIASICENRELQFFSGSAIGPISKYEYENYSTANAFEVEIDNLFVDKFNLQFNYLDLFYNGGPFFKSEDFEDCKIIAKYNDLPMIISKFYGYGKFLLSSFHFEYDCFSSVFEFDADLNKLHDKFAKVNSERVEFSKCLINELIF